LDDQVKSCCAGFYELPVIEMLLGNELHPGGPALTRSLASTALVGRDSSVLDVACGRGESARVLAAHFGCNVIGMDYSSENIDRANVLAGDAAMSDRIRFVQGDAERLPFAAGSFDVVICECSLCVFPDLETALQEFRRVLRPGGRLGISDVVLNEPVPVSLRDLFGHVLCISGALSFDGYREALESAGYASIRSRDASSALDDMIVRIERRARGIGDLLHSAKFEFADGSYVTPSSILEARNFVKEGGVGYAMISARKPRDR
jgi:arsenite methyltransferase